MAPSIAHAGPRGKSAGGLSTRLAAISASGVIGVRRFGPIVVSDEERPPFRGGINSRDPPLVGIEVQAESATRHRNASLELFHGAQAADYDCRTVDLAPTAASARSCGMQSSTNLCTHVTRHSD
jgi:hypothetical protein